MSETKKSWRAVLYHIIEPSAREEGHRLNLYDVFIFVCVAVSVLPLFFKEETSAFIMMDRITAFIFILDYFLRWICADQGTNRKGWQAFARYPFTPMAVIDLLAVIPSLIMMNSFFHGMHAFRIMYFLRVLKVIRIMKAGRYSKSMKGIWNVIKQSKDELLAVGALAVGYIVISALLVFNVEPDTFETYFDAFYWAAISLTTVGYGDIYPVSTIGRSIAMLSSFFGIAIVALPAGIITAEFMNQMNHKTDDTSENTNSGSGT